MVRDRKMRGKEVESDWVNDFFFFEKVGFVGEQK